MRLERPTPKYGATTRFVDQLTLVFEQSGLPPTWGRTLAYMIVCEPPTQSLSDIAEALKASKGAISQSTRALATMGLIDRVPGKQGSREARFRMRKNAFTELMKADIVRLHAIRRIADEALRDLDGTPDEALERLREFRDLYAYFEQVFPDLIEGWIRDRERGER